MRTIKIKGMSCEHCVMAVKKALSGLPGVKEVQVDLKKGEASFTEEKTLEMPAIKKVIENAGFEIG